MANNLVNNFMVKANYLWDEHFIQLKKFNA